MRKNYRRIMRSYYNISRAKRRGLKWTSFSLALAVILTNIERAYASLGQDINNVSNRVQSEAQLAITGIVIIALAIVGVLYATGQKKIANSIAVCAVVGAGIVLLLPSVANFIIGLFG